MHAGMLYSGVAVIHGVTVGGLSYAHRPLVQSSARSRNRAYTCECAAAANVFPFVKDMAPFIANKLLRDVVGDEASMTVMLSCWSQSPYIF